jgi:hypothetical protein
VSEPVTNIAEAPSRRGAPRRFMEGGFTMVGDVMMMKYAQEQATLPPVMRLWMICQARVNRYGHCAFAPGELRDMLGDVDGQRTRYALRTLKKAGMIAKESTSLCVVLDCRVVRREDNANPQCREPTHLHTADRMWMDGLDFEPEAGHWQRVLSDPEKAAKARQKLGTGDVDQVPANVS